MERFLSLGGKEILLKAIIQSIPVYAMAVFKIPKQLCKEINDVMPGFWWGDTEEKRRMHWFAWWRMCIPKKVGGMGFRDLHTFNMTMLAKQSWRLLSNPDSLCARVLRAKYYPDGNLLKAGPKKGSSFTWQSIVAGLQTFKRGHIWRIGDGTKVKIWEDHWVPTSPNRRVFSTRGQCLLQTVDELIDPMSGTWDEALIRANLIPVDAERILRIPLSDQLSEDFVAWHHTKTFCFSVRSAYHIEWNHQFGAKIRRSDGQGSAQVNPVWEKLWKLSVPSKVQIFLWKALHGAVPGRAILAARHIHVPAECPVCHQGAEDIMHLLFTCSRAREVWSALGLKEIINQSLATDRSGSVVLKDLICLPKQKSPILGQLGLQESIAVAYWYIWWQRCEIVKDVSVTTPTRTTFAIIALTATTSEKAMRRDAHGIL
jgi:hypothetical protein